MKPIKKQLEKMEYLKQILTHHEMIDDLQKKVFDIDKHPVPEVKKYKYKVPMKPHELN